MPASKRWFVVWIEVDYC